MLEEPPGKIAVYSWEFNPARVKAQEMVQTLVGELATLHRAE